MKDAGLLDRMKTKNFLVILMLIIISCASIWLLGSPSPSSQNVFNRLSQRTFRDVRSNVQGMQPDSGVTVSSVYLRQLGLDDMQQDEASKAHNSFHSFHGNDQPVIATSVHGDNWEHVVTFSQSAVQHMPGFRLVMFDLTFSEDSHVKLLKYCNRTWNCEVEKVDFKEYPSHVADLSIKSYRPICIQKMLHKYDTVIWADSAEYFKSSNLTGVLKQARTVGLAAWTIEDPTSAISHPKMFSFFQTQPELYYFHRAVHSSHLIIFNTPFVKTKIMTPWVKCALLEDCISPRGSQDTGCNFLRRPLFKYSGCHHYDMSALNIILGSVFDFNENPYATSETIFGNIVEEQLQVKNISDPFHRTKLKLKKYWNEREVRTS